MTDGKRYTDCFLPDGDDLKDFIRGDNGEIACRSCWGVYDEGSDANEGNKCARCKMAICNNCHFPSACYCCANGLLAETDIVLAAIAAAKKEGLTVADWAVKLGVIDKAPVPMSEAETHAKRARESDDEDEEEDDDESAAKSAKKDD